MAILVTLALTMVTLEVALRYFFPRHLTDYGLELTVYFTVWAIFIAGAPLIREGRHVRADILMHMLPPNAQRILEVCGLIVGLIFVCVLSYFGWLMVQNSISSARERKLAEDAARHLLRTACRHDADDPAIPDRIYQLVFRYDPRQCR